MNDVTREYVRERPPEPHVCQSPASEAGSCNCCGSNQSGWKVWVISLGHVQFRVCDRCRKILRGKLA